MQDGKHVILCIDDDEDVRFFLKTMLEANGYVTAEAESAEEGLKVFKEVNPDCIIVDMMMEEIDAGTQFVKEVHAAGSKAPIFMLSSMGDNLSEATDYSELGLSGVFQKPIANDQLLSILQKKLG